MTPTKPSFEDVTGYLGVGALLMLGVFFLIDGPTNVWTTVEQYAKTNSFAILFTVPLLVIAYVLGLLASLAIQTVLERLVPPILTPELFASAAQQSREALLSRYLEVERHSRLLYGCTLSFLILAAGSLSVKQWLPLGQEVVGIVCFVLGVAIAAACPILARRLQLQLKLYVKAFETRPADAHDA
jgi:uncharacterized membrane protein